LALEIESFVGPVKLHEPIGECNLGPIKLEAVFQSYGYLMFHLSFLVGLAAIRACALRAPVILGSFTRKTGRCAPPLAISV
jgi:hypothetical protein